MFPKSVRSAVAEYYFSNIVTYQTLSGDYTEICPWLVRDLTAVGLWNDDVRATIIHHNGEGVSSPLTVPFSTPTGSIQSIPQVPVDTKAIYRTAWEIDPRSLIDMAADRAPFVDQSQSLSLWISLPRASLLVNVRVLVSLPF